jgi:hypothetical protein
MARESYCDPTSSDSTPDPIIARHVLDDGKEVVIEVDGRLIDAIEARNSLNVVFRVGGGLRFHGFDGLGSNVGARTAAGSITLQPYEEGRGLIGFRIDDGVCVDAPIAEYFVKHDAVGKLFNHAGGMWYQTHIRMTKAEYDDIDAFVDVK